MARVVPLHRDAVLLDEIGCLPIRTKPADELALILDLGGKLNRADARVTHRYVLSVPQTAELLASVVVSARTAEPEFVDKLEKAIAAEQARLATEDSE